MFKTKVCALCLCISLVFTGCSKQTETTPELYTEAFTESVKANYTTTQITRGEYTEEITYPAAIYYPTQKKLTFQTVGSQAIFVEFLVGQSEEVEEGTPLANFIVDYDKVALAEKELKLQRAKEDYDDNLYSYMKAVSDQQVICDTLPEGYEKEISKVQLEMKQLEYEQFKYNSDENIVGLTKELEEYKSNLTVTQLCAPMEGIIGYLEPAKEDGDLVKPEEVLAIILPKDGYQLQVEDPDHVLRYNMEVSIGAEYHGDDYLFKGRVISDSRVMSTNVYDDIVTLEILDEIDWLNYINITVTAETVRMSDVLMVEKGAVYLDENPPYVKILDGNTVHKRSITIGDENGEYYWILQGVEEEQTVIMK